MLLLISLALSTNAADSASCDRIVQGIPNGDHRVRLLPCCHRACGLNSLVVYFYVKAYDMWEGYMGRKRDNKEGDLNEETPILKVPGYERSNIKEVGIMEIRVYIHVV